MSYSLTLSVTERFSLSIDGLRRAVAARIAGGAMQAAMIMMVWSRLRRIETRVLALIAAIRAGRVRTQRVGVERRAVRPSVPRLPSVSHLPRGFAWLLPMVPYEAAGFASQLRHVLSDPEMVGLLAASPRLGEILRPLCRMLGLEPGLVTPVPADGGADGMAPVEVAGTAGGAPERAGAG